MRMPVIGVVSASAWVDPDGGVSSCGVCTWCVGGRVVVSSRAQEFEAAGGVVEFANETIFQASSSSGSDRYTFLPLTSSSSRADLCLTSPSRKNPASGQLETRMRGGSWGMCSTSRS
eukprot:3832635-Pleurochrysis_carterae.AAC.5